ncbi:MAG: hypothetical protein WCO30_01250 [bacterium]
MKKFLLLFCCFFTVLNNECFARPHGIGLKYSDDGGAGFFSYPLSWLLIVLFFLLVCGLIGSIGIAIEEHKKKKK